MIVDKNEYVASAQKAYRTLRRIKQAHRQSGDAGKPASRRLTNLSGVVDEQIDLITVAGSVVTVPAGTEIVFWQGATLSYAPERFPRRTGGSAWCTMFDYDGGNQVTVYTSGSVLATKIASKPGINYSPLPWTQQ